MGASISPVTCSICWEGLSENCGRTVVTLQCKQKFHLDCIGSAFNFKGRMECPNCRAIELGVWQQFQDDDADQNVDQETDDDEPGQELDMELDFSMSPIQEDFPESPFLELTVQLPPMEHDISNDPNGSFGNNLGSSNHVDSDNSFETDLEIFMKSIFGSPDEDGNAQRLHTSSYPLFSGQDFNVTGVEWSNVEATSSYSTVVDMAEPQASGSWPSERNNDNPIIDFPSDDDDDLVIDASSDDDDKDA